MNKPDSSHRPRWKRRSLVVVAVILLPIVAFMAWSDRPLSIQEQRLVGHWTDQSVGHGNQTHEYRPNRTVKSIYGEGNSGEYHWRIHDGQLEVVPYQGRSPKKSFRNLFRRSVLFINSILTGSPSPANDEELYSIKWLDDDTFELTAKGLPNTNPGFTFTMHREPK